MRAATELATRWLELERALEAKISLTAIAMQQAKEAGKAINYSTLLSNRRYRELLAQVREQVLLQAQWTEGFIKDQQRILGKLGINHATEAIQLSFFDAGEIGAFFNRVPVSAVERMVGLAGDGSPLRALFQASFPNVVEQLSSTLIESTLLGRNPRDTAKLMADAAGGELNRMMTIARTEQIRVYREAARQQYVTSGVVDGYKRLAARQVNTCAMCIALDGEEYPTDEFMSVHPNDRCTMVPNVIGLPAQQWQKGPEWLANQPEDVQREILGPGAFELWNDNQIELQDLVRKYNHPEWGPSIQRTPLRDLSQ
jgi:hypothetical protein